MARKKAEIQLQQVIETQEEWEEMLAKEGLTVVDVYQEWAGPCKAMVSNFKRLKNELGDDLLRFTVAKADTVDSLEKYRYTCKPCFLYFAGGVLVAVVRGCNSPLLLKTITEQLAYEHKVLDGNAERKEIRDTVVDSMGPKDDKSDEEEEEEEVKKEVTVAVIRPDIVSEGKVDEVIEKMKASGLEILEHQERVLTEDEAREFYSHSKDEEYFEGLVQLMTSGPSHVLVITKGDTGAGVIEQWRELIGPPNVEKAKEEAPESFRATFGKEGFANALHGSDSKDTAMKELAFFFPQFSVPTVPGKGGASKPRIQRTLALIRPDAVKDEEVRANLLSKIRDAGFEIAMQKEVTITKEQAEEFYKEHKGQEYFEELTTRMSSGPLLALCLAREDAVTGWREMLGPAKLEEAKAEAPDSLRAQYSVDGVELNQIHGADTTENAEKEIGFFFPVQQTVAVIKPDAYENRDAIMDKIKEAGFHIAARRETELTKDTVAQLYKDQQDKEYFGDLAEHMTSGPTLFMVLSGEDAVDGWRQRMGPTDPSQAPEGTVRAQFGTDVKANAVHGASTEEAAKELMANVFGELEFDGKGDSGEDTSSSQKPSEESQQEQQQPAAEESQQAEESSQKAAEESQAEGQTEETTQEGGGEAAKDEDTKSTKSEVKDTEVVEGEKAEETKEETTEEKPAEGETQQEEASSEPKAEGEAEQTEQSEQQPAETKEEGGGGETEEAPKADAEPEQSPAAEETAAGSKPASPTGEEQKEETAGEQTEQAAAEPAKEGEEAAS